MSASDVTREKHIITFLILALVWRELHGFKQLYMFEIPVLILSKWMTTDLEINPFVRQIVLNVFSIRLKSNSI